MFLKSPKQMSIPELPKVIRSVDLTAPENAAFVMDFSKARSVGLLLNWDVSEYVAQRRRDAGMDRNR